MRSNIKFIGLNLSVLIGIMLLMEVGIGYLLNNPKKIPASFVAGLRNYYMQKDRRIIQYLPDCAQYDPQLFYRLRPGTHTFSNREFSTGFTVNSFGLRDDEASMHQPRIICLGDSYTMGWGVADDENVPALLEQKTGLTTLNAGISSYGTVRELKLLSLLDTDSVKYLILQFAINDNTENVQFFNNGNRYEPSPEHEYDEVVKSHAEAVAYFPFKHISHFIRSYFEKAFPALNTEEVETEEASSDPQPPYINPTDAFLNVINAFSLPDSVPIILYQVGEGGTEILLDPLKEKLKQNNLKNPIHIVDTHALLGEDDYYLLDQHLTPQGHAIVADALADVIAF